MKCNCPDWEPNIKIVNAPLMLQFARSGGKASYTGKQFVFCPWCGQKLLEDNAPDVNRCERCRTPCFGKFCGKCKGERTLTPMAKR